jgi:hypothetical protein
MEDGADLKSFRLLASTCRSSKVNAVIGKKYAVVFLLASAAEKYRRNTLTNPTVSWHVSTLSCRCIELSTNFVIDGAQDGTKKHSSQTHHIVHKRDQLKSIPCCCRRI